MLTYQNVLGARKPCEMAFWLKISCPEVKFSTQCENKIVLPQEKLSFF